MTPDAEKPFKDQLVQTILKNHPHLSPRLLAATIRLPRSPFFPGESPERLFAQFHPKGWGGRIAPSILDTLLILTETPIHPGDRIAVYRLTDPYFLLLLLELTHRIVLVEDNEELFPRIQESVRDLGYAYIPVLSSLSELSGLPSPVLSILHVGNEGKHPLNGNGNGIPMDRFKSWSIGSHLEKMKS
ncbi:MAG: hypothetical protein ACYCYP_02500 [Leptospirales bacterium]